MPPLQSINYINEINEWIEHNLDENYGLDLLSHRLGYCKRTIQAVFKKTYGMSIGRYIQLRRIHRAAVMLKMTNLSVTDIAHFLHYTSHNNFCRAFKKVFKETPQVYRGSYHYSSHNIIFPRVFCNKELTYEVIAMSDKYISGVERVYSDCIYNVGISREKLNFIKEHFLDSSQPLVVASKVMTDTYSMALGKHGGLKYAAIVGDMVSRESLKSAARQLVHKSKGLYLYSSFCGTVDEYRESNADIHLHVLPKLSLARTYEPKIEVFHSLQFMREQGEKICCEQYIPVDRVSN